MSTLSKLNKALEFQLNQLMSADLTGEVLDEEIKRNKAITATSREITSLHRLVLDATKLSIETGNTQTVDKALLTIEGKEVGNG